MSEKLDLINISLYNKDFRILNGLNLSLSPGKFTAIIGPNGAGKSSLLKILSGECRSYTGNIHWGKRNWNGLSDKEMSTQRAMLRQQFHMTFSFEVSDILEMGRYPHQKSNAYNQSIIQEVMACLQLENLLHKSYHTLSGGEQQRVQLGRVLAQIWDAPKEAVLLLDEPVSALDIRYQHQLLHMLQKLAAEKGWLVLAVLHDLNQVMQYADEVVLMKKGTIVSSGKPMEVMTPENLKESYHIHASWINHEEFSLPTIKIQYV